MPKTPFDHRPPRSWTKISITVPTLHAETVAAFMANLSENGIEQIGGATTESASEWEQIIAYLPEVDPAPTPQGLPMEKGKQIISTIHAFLQALNKKLPASTPAQLTQERIEEEDWNQRWKDHFKPFKLTERLVIKPSWEEYEKLPQEMVLEMDPGMAFGTGLHASTQLALILIEDAFAVNPAKTVLDIGTGTGILGMYCALLGADTVVGLDNDIDARSAASGNIHTNHLESIMTIDPRDLNAIDGLFELIIANITQDVLTLLAPTIGTRLAPGGRLVLSGILTGSQTDTIKGVYGDLGLTLVHTRSRDEWTALLFASPIY
jgi:ribosomal protein L11 methyltransferase